MYYGYALHVGCLGTNTTYACFEAGECRVPPRRASDGCYSAAARLGGRLHPEQGLVVPVVLSKSEAIWGNTVLDRLKCISTCMNVYIHCIVLNAQSVNHIWLWDLCGRNGSSTGNGILQAGQAFGSRKVVGHLPTTSWFESPAASVKKNMALDYDPVVWLVWVMVCKISTKKSPSKIAKNGPSWTNDQLQYVAVMMKLIASSADL